MSSLACTATAPTRRTRRLELADIVRDFGLHHREAHAPSGEQLQAMNAIVRCRTPALGGHVESCDHCGTARAVYHSCRNRHCPKCQTLTKQRWLEERCAELLPVPHFHVVFTLPHELNPWLLRWPRLLHGLLFHAAAETLQAFGRDPKHLGAELGVTAVLHTWSQTLAHHVHLHCVVTGGGLSLDGERWVRSRTRFLFPVRAMSVVFRGKYLDGLSRLVERGELPGGVEWAKLSGKLRRHRWVVYCKPPFGRPEQVLEYLGRYTHRIAISNDRLVELKDGRVRFRYRDRAGGDVSKVMSLPAEEFLRRFLLHVLPRGFMRIRHSGLLANRHRKDKLARCRELLGHTPAPEPPRANSAEAVMDRVAGIDLTLCPSCKQGRMHRTATLEPGQLPPSRCLLIDTS